MIRKTISLTQPQAEFLAQHQHYGFKDGSEMVRAALGLLQETFETKSLWESAEIYAQVYATDVDLQEITVAAQAGWPE